jgi:hypothetical protein
MARRFALVVVLAFTTVLISDLPTRSHLVGFGPDPGIVSDWYHHNLLCVYHWDNCSWHSFRYASSNDIAGSRRVCAVFLDVNRGYVLGERACANGLARRCLNNNIHSGGGGDPTHCVDQDGTFYKVASENASSQGTTIRRHVVY